MSEAAEKYANIFNERMALLLSACVDVSAGTLWWVREDVWKEKSKKYDHDSTRMGHPGLSMRHEPVTSLYEYVPMLHGTSGDRGPVVARGLSEEYGPDYPTSFGRLAPAGIVVQDMVKSSGQGPLIGSGLATRRVVGNPHKPRLDESEMGQLQNWMRKRGLMP